MAANTRSAPRRSSRKSCTRATRDAMEGASVPGGDVKNSTDGPPPLRYGARRAHDTDDRTDPAWTLRRLRSELRPPRRRIPLCGHDRSRREPARGDDDAAGPSGRADARAEEG